MSATRKSILLVEDDAIQAKSLIEALQSDGWQVAWANSLAEARNQPMVSDIYLVDRGLPDGDGMDLLSWVQQQPGAPPVILLTAQNTIDERVRGLEDGAADYVGKGVDIREILMRCDMQWRNLERSRSAPASLIILGAPDASGLDRLVISPADRIAAREARFHSLASKADRRSQTLEPAALAVLLHLARNAGRTIGAQELERRFFYRTETTNQGLRNVISKIRKRIDGEAQATFLHTYLPRRRGETAGYVLLERPCDITQAKARLTPPDGQSND